MSAMFSEARQSLLRKSVMSQRTPDPSSPEKSDAIFRMPGAISKAVADVRIF